MNLGKSPKTISFPRFRTKNRFSKNWKNSLNSETKMNRGFRNQFSEKPKSFRESDSKIDFRFKNESWKNYTKTETLLDEVKL